LDKKGASMNAYVLLGCNGFTDTEGFLFCNSITNHIVDLSKIKYDEKERVINFLDKACGLFDAACYDYNKCINIVNFLYRQYGIIDEDGLHKIQAFLKMHKRCGIYVMLILKEDYSV